MEDCEVPEWDYNSFKRRILQTSPLDDRIVAIEECAQQVKSLTDKEKVSAVQLIILPLSSGTTGALRRCIFGCVENVVKQNCKFLIGGLLLEMDIVSKRFLNAIGSRMAQEEALLWLKVLMIIVTDGKDVIQGEVTKKTVTIAARLATAGLKGKR